ncbi:MAG TPA: hypothetical protein VIL46_08125 [Gemmataceae bacterium]
MCPRSVKLWIGCSFAHGIAVGVCLFFASSLMVVTREPSALAVGAAALLAVLISPAWVVRGDYHIVPLLIANSLLWGLAIAVLFVCVYAALALFRRLIRPSAGHPPAGQAG